MSTEPPTQKPLGVVTMKPADTLPIRAETTKGFAALDRDQRRQIASAGGRAAHKNGTAHKFTSDEARNAGRKGGNKVSQDREHMATIGSKGGLTRTERVRAALRARKMVSSAGATKER